MYHPSINSFFLVQSLKNSHVEKIQQGSIILSQECAGLYAGVAAGHVTTAAGKPLEEAAAVASGLAGTRF